MDTKMEDIGKMPETHESAAVVEAPNINALDGWIECLMQCKQLSEADVQRLCDKVSAVQATTFGNPSCSGFSL